MQLKSFNYDLSNFLKEGESLLNVKLNDSIDTLELRLGSYISKTGDKEVGFFKYANGLRFGYFKQQVDEIAILFFDSKKANYTYVVEATGQVESINKKTMIHDIIRILNIDKIDWSCWDTTTLNMFCIRTAKNIFISFDLDTGRIFMMSRPRL
jgi:hypothetical protein